MEEYAESIPGIHNYCDSWCERCMFTKRCQNFASQYPNGLQQKEMKAETLVKRLMEALELTKRYVENNRPQALPASAVVRYEVQAASAAPAPSERHPLATLCDDYLRQTADWLKQEMNLLQQAGHQQAQEVNLGLRSEGEALVLLNALKDAWEIIKWYRTLIPVKVISALQMPKELTQDQAMAAYFVGKAKLVLVSVDSSLLAWHTLLNHYPEKTDEMLDMLVLLDRIRRQIEESFPTARAFRRPGLD